MVASSFNSSMVSVSGLENLRMAASGWSFHIYFYGHAKLLWLGLLYYRQLLVIEATVWLAVYRYACFPSIGYFILFIVLYCDSFAVLLYWLFVTWSRVHFSFWSLVHLKRVLMSWMPTKVARFKYWPLLSFFTRQIHYQNMNLLPVFKL